MPIFLANIVAMIVELGVAIWKTVRVVTASGLWLPLVVAAVAAISATQGYVGVYHSFMRAYLASMHSYLSSIPLGDSTAECWTSAMGFYDDIKVIYDAIVYGFGAALAQWIVGWSIKSVQVFMSAGS